MINKLKVNITAALLFISKTTTDTNLFQHRLDNSGYHAKWNICTELMNLKRRRKVLNTNLLYYLGIVEQCLEARRSQQYFNKFC
jgi:hypothetical protein